MRGSIGLVIGLAVGAGGMYLGLKRPWEHHTVAPAADNPPVVVVPDDAGTRTKPKKKHRPASTGQGARPAAGNDDTEEVDLGPTQVTLTAADRALEKRGDDVSLPPRNVDMSSPSANRSLEDAEISGVLNTQAGGIKDCVVKGATGTDLKATITIKMVVDGRGRPGKTRIEAPHYLFEHGLQGCLQRAVARIQFPATGEPTLVTFPLTLGG